MKEKDKTPEEMERWALERLALLELINDLYGKGEGVETYKAMCDVFKVEDVNDALYLRISGFFDEREGTDTPAD